ncbi:MAG: hypothetical protein OCC45_10585 [Desulfotalea sp.]
MSNYKDILKDLDHSILDLKSKGITVDALNQARNELVAHTENIEKVENNIEAVRKEVLSPIKDELKQNRTAGRFSILGFWVGALSMIVSISSIGLNYLQSNKEVAKVEQLVSKNNNVDIIEDNHVLPQVIFNDNKYTTFTFVDLTSKVSKLNNKPVSVPSITIEEVNTFYFPTYKNVQYIKTTAKDEKGIYKRLYVKRDSPLGDIVESSIGSKGNIYSKVVNDFEEGALVIVGWQPFDKI